MGLQFAVPSTSNPPAGPFDLAQAAQVHCLPAPFCCVPAPIHPRPTAGAHVRMQQRHNGADLALAPTGAPHGPVAGWELASPVGGGLAGLGLSGRAPADSAANGRGGSR